MCFTYLMKFHLQTWALFAYLLIGLSLNLDKFAILFMVKFCHFIF